MVQAKERDIGKPSQRACPVSVLSFLMCVLILVRVELVHRQTISVRDQFHSQQDWKSIVEHSEDSGEKQTRHRRDVRHLTMAEVTAEIDKKLRAFTATLCSPKEKKCAQGPPGPPGKTGANGVPGRPGGGVSEPKVYVSPSNLTVDEHQNASFYCSATGSPTPEVTWSRAEDSGNKALKSNNGVLQIHNAGLSDIGKYTCSAKNLVGTQKESVKLFVKVPPRLRGVYFPTHEGFLTLTTTLTCDVIGFPDPVVTWNPLFTKRHVTQGKTIVIEHTQASDEGAYICVGKSVFGFVFQAIFLKVLSIEPPKLEVVPRSTVAVTNIGEVVNITCSASGRPTPEVTWTKDGKIVRDVTVTKKTTSRNVTSELVIKNFQPRHNGIYTCMFHNEKNQKVEASTRVELANCGHPGSIPNGHVIGSRYWSGDVIFFSCNRGYTLTGLKTRVCMASGQWSEKEPTCRRTCHDPGSPINGFRVGSRFWEGEHVTYGCHDGHQMRGSVRRICQKDGRWSGITPSCSELANCRHPGSVPYGHVIGSRYRSGDVVVIGCNRGYTLTGPGTRVCMSSGRWSEYKPTCRRTRCPDPGSPTNGLRVGGRFWEGGQITYRCHHGHQMRGSVRRVCQRDGRWSGVMPTCSVPSECRQYSVLSERNRNSWKAVGKDEYDDHLPKGWYRFQGGAGIKMADTCVPKYSCGTRKPGWFSGGSHPTVAEGVVTRKVCWHASSCCPRSDKLRVRNCGTFFVYELGPSPTDDYFRYCGQW